MTPWRLRPRQIRAKAKRTRAPRPLRGRWRARRTYPRAYPSKAGGGRGSGADCRGSGGAAGRPAKSGTAAGLPRARGLHPRHSGAGGTGSGAGLLARQSAQAQEFAARAAQEAWSEAAAGFRQRVPDFDVVAHNPNLSITPIIRLPSASPARAPRSPITSARTRAKPRRSRPCRLSRRRPRLPGSKAVSVRMPCL